MLEKVLLVVVILVAGIFAVALTKPDTFSVQRSVNIKAPPEKIFAVLNNFKRWPDGSPWEKLDPAMQRTHSGAASSKGAAYAWKGNREVGAGRMAIRESTPPNRVSMQLDFIEPFEGHNTADFLLAAKGDSTDVTWRMTGPPPLVSKLMQVFVSMDTLIGKDFEAGLANLKALTEK